MAFHEYSHILSYLLKKDDANNSEGGKWRRDVGQCLIGFHSGVDKFEEEDFADLIGVDVAKAQRSIFCQSLSNEDDHWLTLVNSNEEDKHSGEDVRIKRCLPN